MEITWEFAIIDFAIILGFVAILFVFLTARYFFYKSKVIAVDKKFVAERWQEIEGLLRTKKQMNYKLAIIEADKLLDDVLKKMSFPGGKMSVRLKMASYKYPKLKRVWWAHKVRNHVVHEIKYTVSAGEARKVISLFRQSLKVLKVL